ncbi:hypothetical protein V6N13_138626 [Hibiscus sabdariffa]
MEFWCFLNLKATLIALLLILFFHFSKKLYSKFLNPPSSSTLHLPSPSSSGHPPGSQSRTPEIVSDSDLKFLIDSLDEKLDEEEKWENVFDKKTDFLSYIAKCCRPKDKPLKYLSTTVFESCSPELLRDFYMDNDYRKLWDKMVIDHVQLQVNTANGIEIGRTVKKFPLLTPREYVLAWRLWEGKDRTFYCFIKECEHPSAPRQKKYVRVRYFRSGWRIRKVPGRDASEIRMFHQEDAGLNVEMAKLAFARGIWSYICKMDNALRKYSAINHPLTTSVSSASLIQKVPPELDTLSGDTPPAVSASIATLGTVNDEPREKKLSRIPSKKIIAKSLLVAGGVICLSRGHAGLGAKVAMAYILTKLRKHCDSSSQRYLLLSCGTLISLVHAETEKKEESALNVMFKSLNAPSQLSGWRASGGDPCGNSWEGIKCSGSKVTEISLSNYGLNGELGYKLSNLTSLTSLDLSKNNLNGQIPYQLPPNAVRINLSQNQFTGNVPYSISQMTKVENMHLQNNGFTGTINVIRDLPIEDLDVENNQFSGWIPNELKGIGSLKTGGNSWSTGKAPPPPPGVVHRHPEPGEEQDMDGDGKENSNLVRNIIIIAASCFGFLLLVAGICALLSLRQKSVQPSSQFIDEEKNAGRKGPTPFQSQEFTAESYAAIAKGSKGLATIYSGVALDRMFSQNSDTMEFKRSGSVSGRPSSVTEPARLLKARGSASAPAVAFSFADLQNATVNFESRHLLGEGNIGRVYTAKCVDGKDLAVKKIDSTLIQGLKPEGFSEIVENISRLHHPNIAELIGYCSEQGQYLLVYEHYRNGSLHEFLHVSDDFSKPLTWNTRLSIALGAARGVEYLHHVCSPPIVHKNIKSSNILLDHELNPRLSDYGMAQFHERTSRNLGMGYNAPECTRPSAYTLKSDVYSFGAVMLELLTGRKPLDNDRPKSEQCLVKWASPQLNDADALAVMVDPALRGLYPPKSLPPFAEIIALCVKSDPKLRPTMSEVVQSLVQLVQQSNINMRDELSSPRQEEDEDYSVFV